jgi:hypothetical protein
MARLLVVLVLLTSVLAGCGGKGAPESTSVAKLLPNELGGAKLRKESYPGKVWLKARPEVSFAPEVSADISVFLNRLRKSPADLSVAWALSDDGPKVVAYRVIDTDANALVKSFVEAVRGREKIRSAKTVLAGKDVIVTFGVSVFRGYVYAKDDVLYATNTST